MADLLVHFETKATKPPVFRMTADPIAAALMRSRLAGVRTTLGSDFASTGWIAEATGLVTSNDVLRDARFPLKDLARAAPKLRMIHIIGAGIEPLLPLDWLHAGVTLTNNSGVHADKIRESATMALLMLNARLPAMTTNQRAARWEQIFSSTIAGKTAVIVGTGAMGTATAEAAAALGMTVIGASRSGAPKPAFARVVAIGALDSVLPQADIVVIATPLTPETRNLLDARRLALLKPGAALLNIGRAAVVDEAALLGALDSGALACAITDVYPSEPLPATSPLWGAQNLIMIPHVSSDDLDRYMPKTYDLAFANIARLLRGEPLVNAVDPARGY
jgi:phosphoglycerate dehydrogenase-like enzyme